MDLQQPWALLGGMTPRQFMRRHWQRKPLLVRQAWPDVRPPLSRQQLFELAASRDVESRVVTRDPGSPDAWKLRRGPIPRRALPPLRRPAWTLLVQGVDLHVERAHAMLSAFRFVPDARLDDLMVSYASDGGGVGPHLDSYDVFLLQVHGQRRWRIGAVQEVAFVDGLPLRILRDFQPEHEWVLDPGDLLYLPPRWGHDGIAVGECMTCSIGFRVPSRGSLAAELLGRVAEEEDRADPLYSDPGQPATGQPARIPAGLQAFAREAVRARLRREDTLMRALGEVLTEPKPQVWFAERSSHALQQGVRLDRRTRMMYDDRHLFVNGESFRIGGRDARLLARLADARSLTGEECGRLGAAAREELTAWVSQGWAHPVAEDDR